MYQIILFTILCIKNIVLIGDTAQQPVLWPSLFWLFIMQAEWKGVQPWLFVSLCLKDALCWTTELEVENPPNTLFCFITQS